MEFVLTDEGIRRVMSWKEAGKPVNKLSLLCYARSQDLRLGIESLSESDMTGAAASYRRLSSRWLAVRQLARAN